MNVIGIFDRIASLFRRRRLEDELEEEVRTHIELATEENLRRGMNPGEARAAARRSFGGIDQMKETHRERRGLPALESIAADFRFAARCLSKHRGFTAATVTTLGLGIGCCTIVFAAVNAVLIKSLPYPNPERLVFAGGMRGGEASSISPADFLDYRSQNRSFEELAATASSLAPMTLTSLLEPQRVRVASVSGNFFEVFRVRSERGRGLTTEDEAGTDSVAVISHALWQSRFGARENVIGATVRLNGNAVTIVGVMPAGFDFPNRPDVWTPIFFNQPEFQSRAAHFLLAVGRLRDDVPVEAAQNDMAAIASRLEQTYPETNKGFGLEVTQLEQRLAGFLENPLRILMTAVGLLLLLSCANAANLILARGASRRRELATRIAVGAGRARLIRLLMSESVLLALAGGLVGVFLASSVIPLLIALPFEGIPFGQPIPGLSETRIDFAVLGFAFITSLLASLLVGLVPALKHSYTEATELRSAPGAAARLRQPLSKALVIFEVGISLTLLVGAGLVFRSFLNIARVDPGFNPEGVLTLPVNPTPSADRNRSAYFANLLEVVGRIPGVQAAALTSELPLSGYSQEWFFDIEGRPAPSPTERPIAGYRRVSSEYFRAMEIPIRRGRPFTQEEVFRRVPVAVIDERLAALYFPSEDPVGKRIVYGTTAYEIVGLAGNVLQYALFQEVFFGGAYPTVYVPDVETGGSAPTLVVRAVESAGSVMQPLRATLQRVDRNLPADIRPYEEILSAGMLLPRFGTAFLAVFSGVGLVLAVIGLYGVMAFSTTGRANEIGIRMALGSSRASVLKLIVSDGVKLSLLGIVAGLAGAYGFSKLLQRVLVRVESTDPATFALMSLLIAAAAFCASYIPARMATQTDPARALRHD